MNIFTVTAGKVEKGAEVRYFELKKAGVRIPAIIIGEEGRGRKLGVLPVALSQASEAVLLEKGSVKINNATLGQTKTGAPKLFETSVVSNQSEALVVFKTQMGYRGGNRHRGDKFTYKVWAQKYTVYKPAVINDSGEKTWDWQAPSFDLSQGPELAEQTLRQVGVKAFFQYHSYTCDETVFAENNQHLIDLAANPEANFFQEEKTAFHPWPCTDICTGVIAQGDAGRMGSGEQKVSILKEGDIVRTSYSGRMYGQPDHHYYMLKNGELLGGLTREERDLSDLF